MVFGGKGWGSSCVFGLRTGEALEGRKSIWFAGSTQKSERGNRRRSPRLLRPQHGPIAPKRFMKMAEPTTSEPQQRPPTGCIVVLEPGAKWPSNAFAKVPDRDGVAVVHVAAEDEPERIFERLARQFPKLTSGGIVFRTVLVACAMSSAMQPIDRATLSRQIQRNMRSNSSASVTFVNADSE
jgi:hypothetical protein